MCSEGSRLGEPHGDGSLERGGDVGRAVRTQDGGAVSRAGEDAHHRGTCTLASTSRRLDGWGHWLASAPQALGEPVSAL